MSETTIRLIKNLLADEENYRLMRLYQAKRQNGSVDLAEEILQDARNAIKEFDELLHDRN